MSKHFGSLVALDDVSFRLEPGSFHALLGENGAGKSTLVKCIMGFYQADRGRVLVGGQPISLKSPREAQRHGIGMVYQHFTLVENMTVAENLVLARAEIPPVIDWNKEQDAIAAFIEGMPFKVPVKKLVRQLAAGEKQKLEIIKQLYLGSRIVILDEPTSVLTPQEADEVLGMLREMAGSGRVSVAMITHKFREVMQFADSVTVLRRGRLAGTGSTRDLTPEAMAEMMVGSEPPQASLERTSFDHTSREGSSREGSSREGSSREGSSREGSSLEGSSREGSSLRARESLLEIRDLTALDDLGLPVLRGITLGVRAGEIVGIAGVSGNGQDELVEVLGGQRPASGGRIHVGGKPYRATRADLRQQRVRLLPEAPLRNACVADMSVAENIAFRTFDVPPFSFLRWLVDHTHLRRHARTAVREYRIKTPSVDTPIGALSGGNVQRAVLARELTGEVSLLIAANPCFGLDFAAVSEIRSRIMSARNAGAAVLLVSADLEEIFALSDRILVMSEGKIVFETPAGAANIAEIGRHMAGSH
ncbi:MAG: ABC transporter ATP-binding protein [Myxococcota bacterium]